MLNMNAGTCGEVCAQMCTCADTEGLQWGNAAIRGVVKTPLHKRSAWNHAPSSFGVVLHPLQSGQAGGWAGRLDVAGFAVIAWAGGHICSVNTAEATEERAASQLPGGSFSICSRLMSSDVVILR